MNCFYRQVVLTLLITCLLATPFHSVWAASFRAVVGDTRTSTNEWNDFYRSTPDSFKKLTGYRISFQYEILAHVKGADFYVVVNDLTQLGRTFDWQEWSGAPGTEASIHTIFIDRDEHDYSLVIGIHGQGEIRISNLRINAEPQLKPLNLVYPDPSRTWTSGTNRTYYIDSTAGNDQNDGLKPTDPWQTLARVNTGRFAPGDHIMLRSGSTWPGCLSLAGAGSAGRPITVDEYGDGAKPRIMAAEKWLAAVYVHNCSNIRISNLDVSNSGRQQQPKLVGVEVAQTVPGTAHGIVLNDLDVHDITGSELKSEGGGAGIDCTCTGDQTNFDGLIIEGCRLSHTDRNGITMSGDWERDKWFPSRHVVIRDNILTDIGGDGIVPSACDGAIIEHNTISGARMRAPDFAAGIWPWSCDNTVIQYNNVSGLKGTKDGEGFDSDWNCRNSLFQYNYSHDNDGGFMLICDDGTTYMPYNIGNSGTVVRYNISVDDGQFTFYISGPVSQTKIYNNTIYIGKHSAHRLVQSGTWGWAWPSATAFLNNLFYVDRPVDFDFGGMTNVSFVRNAYWGSIEPPLNDHKAILIDPMIARAGGPDPLDYRPVAGSPLFMAGTSVADNGGRDYRGEIVNTDRRPTIGAFQQ